MAPLRSIFSGGLTPALVWISTVTGLLVMLAFFAVIGFDFYRSTIASAEQQGSNIATLIEQDIGRNIELYDLSIQAVLDGISDDELMRQSPRIREIALFDRSATAPGLGAMVVLNRHGDIVEDSLSVAPRKGNFADREYFKVHERAQIGLYISKPFEARLQKRIWSLSLSRRINKPDGSFGGIVSGTLKLDYFRQRFKAVNLGRKGTISLLRDDGILLVQNSPDDSRTGADWSQAPIMRHLKTAPSGSFWSTQSQDGVPRFYSYKRVGNMPLVVSVGFSQSGVMGPWWDKIVFLCLSYVIMAASIIALVGMFVRELRGRQLAERVQASLARRDTLTGLHNRLGFNEALEAEWHRARFRRGPLSLLMLDIDHFKRYNDCYGHLEGDLVLGAIGSVVRSLIRHPFDIAARYGGEEIVLILPDTDAADAAAIARLLRHAIEMLKIPHAMSEHGVVTASIGVATIIADDGSATSLIKHADAALYRAKHQGRNRVETAPLVTSRSGEVATATG
jgi:diguanylate cyclase (GGDEF)-like protein